LLQRVNCLYNSGRSHDIELMKIVIADMLEENGVTVFLGCAVADVIKKDGIITHALITTQSGLKTVCAKIFIDATGDGVLSYLAGETVEYGRNDGLVQPMSIMFTIENVNPEQKLLCFHEEMDTPLKKGNYLDLCKNASKTGELPETVNIVRLYRGVVETERMVNATQVNTLNPLLPQDLGKAHATLRRQMNQIVAFLKNNVEGFENIRIKHSTEGVGIRESRRVVCEYVMKSDDLLNGLKHDDVIVHNACFCLDIHNPSGAGQSEQTGRPKNCKPYDIPYRSVLPLKTDNLLVAGRCIGGSHRAHSSYRVMNICLNVGQAVGIAGAICVKEGVLPRKLDYRKIQKVLIEKNIKLVD
ncbi:MAG: FAD-dependent oxidoreductase, partial [Candidatus Scatosoma sp.]